ncbi:hypothetical protein TNCV_2536841 [Trichonephila clavipes]|nr:hypothetical protein TNCV_2536841 [Trichonephila clavipes]
MEQRYQLDWRNSFSQSMRLSHLCESAFSVMNVTKPTYYFRFIDDHLESSASLAVRNYIPRNSRFADSMQTKSSTDFYLE